MNKIVFKKNFVGYFRFYYQVLGNRLFVYFIINLLMGILDGLGLTMFIPLLQVANGNMTQEEARKSLGGLHGVVDILAYFSLPLNIFSVLVLMVIIFLLKGALKYFQVLYFSYLRTFFIKRVRNGLTDKLVNLNYEGFMLLDAGRIQNTFIAEVNRVFETFSSYFDASQAFILLTTYIVMAFAANPQFALLVTLGGVCSNLVYRKIYNSTKKISIELSLRGNKFNGFLLQIVNNYKYLKATNRLSTYAYKVRDVINNMGGLSLRMGKYDAIIESIKEPIIVIIVAGVILFQVHFMHGNFSAIILSLLLFYRSLQYLMNLQQCWQRFISNVGGIVVVGELWNEMDRYNETDNSHQYYIPFEKLEIVNLYFSYGKTPVLKNINISIEKNKTVAFVGESGSGKSTLINLLIGLLSPTKGSVLVDGNKLSSIDGKKFRSRIGLISQEPVIFKDSVYNNITFWAEKSPENLNLFWKTLKLAALYDFVIGLPEQENAQLGDNGKLISGGQKQRISIARELFKECDLLIMDEATSALDSETEKIIKDNINTLKGKYTMVIIAHRLSTIRNADRIYLLDNGAISSFGDFAYLEQHSSKFRRMVELQEL